MRKLSIGLAVAVGAAVTVLVFACSTSESESPGGQGTGPGVSVTITAASITGCFPKPATRPDAEMVALVFGSLTAPADYGPTPAQSLQVYTWQGGTCDSSKCSCELDASGACGMGVGIPLADNCIETGGSPIDASSCVKTQPVLPDGGSLAFIRGSSFEATVGCTPQGTATPLPVQTTTLPVGVFKPNAPGPKCAADQVSLPPAQLAAACYSVAHGEACAPGYVSQPLPTSPPNPGTCTCACSGDRHDCIGGSFKAFDNDTCTGTGTVMEAGCVDIRNIHGIEVVEQPSVDAGCTPTGVSTPPTAAGTTDFCCFVCDSCAPTQCKDEAAACKGVAGCASYAKCTASCTPGNDCKCAQSTTSGDAVTKGNAYLSCLQNRCGRQCVPANFDF